MSNTRWHVTAAWVAGVVGLAALAACGDNAPAHPVPPPARVVVRIDPAGAADCPYGGSVVNSSVDANGNGALDDGARELWIDHRRNNVVTAM